MNDFTQRRIPKRKDRINLIWVVSAAALVLPLVGLFYPVIGDFLFNRLITVYVVGILILFLMITAYQWWAWGNAWRNFAETNGLRCELEKPYAFSLLKWPIIEGTYQGYPIRVERFTKRSGKYKKIYTAIQVTLREPVGSTLRINANTWWSGLMRAFSRNDLETVQLGDLDLDRKLKVQSDAEQFAKSALSSVDIQQRLVEIGSQAPEMQVEVQGKGLKYSERTSITDGEYLYALLHTLTLFAAYVERHGYDPYQS